MAVTLLLTAVTVAVSLAVRHVLGFGFSLTFVPLASFFLTTREAVLTAILLEIVIGLLLAVELRRHLRLRESVQLQLASLLGIVGGLGALRIFSPATLFRLSLIPLLAVALLLCVRPNLKTRPSRAKLAAAGLMSGAMNVWASFSGPPVVLYYLATEASASAIKGLLTGYFLLLYLFTAAGLAFSGEYGRFAAWLPALLGGVVITVLFPLSRNLAGAVEPWFRRLAAGFLLLVALAALVKALY